MSMLDTFRFWWSRPDWSEAIEACAVGQMTKINGWDVYRDLGHEGIRFVLFPSGRRDIRVEARGYDEAASAVAADVASFIARSGRS